MMPGDFLSQYGHCFMQTNFSKAKMAITCGVLPSTGDSPAAASWQKIPAHKATDKHIVIITDKDTRIGRDEQRLRFEDLRVGMTIHVEGFELFRGNHAREVTAILARVIHPTIH